MGQSRQTFSSDYSRKWLNASGTYTGQQFHFHAGSEHTIDGERHDLEMYTVHVADDANRAQSSGFGYAAVGIMFSVEHSTAKLNQREQIIIDKFFDSMYWTAPQAGLPTGGSGKAADDGHRLLKSKDDEEEKTVADKVNYGDLMMMINTKKRWVYKGSVKGIILGINLIEFDLIERKKLFKEIGNIINIEKYHAFCFFSTLSSISAFSGSSSFFLPFPFFPWI